MSREVGSLIFDRVLITAVALLQNARFSSSSLLIRPDVAYLIERSVIIGSSA